MSSLLHSYTSFSRLLRSGVTAFRARRDDYSATPCGNIGQGMQRYCLLCVCFHVYLGYTLYWPIRRCLGQFNIKDNFDNKGNFLAAPVYDKHKKNFFSANRHKGTILNSSELRPVLNRSTEKSGWTHNLHINILYVTFLFSCELAF